MSQFTYEPIPTEQSNGLAIAGFVCSLLGFFTGFLLSPIGLILSREKAKVSSLLNNPPGTASSD